MPTSIKSSVVQGDRALAAAIAAPRVFIERLSPWVEGHAAKATEGQVLCVEADIFSDGHAGLAAELHWQQAPPVPMEYLGNDRWRALITPQGIGLQHYRIEAWIDMFGTLARDLRKKREAGQDVGVEILEGFELLSAACRFRPRDALQRLVAGFAAGTPEQQCELLLAESTRRLMQACGERSFRLASARIAVDVERLRAGYGSWYELFARSQSREPGRHGTFDDVIQRLPAIKAMGFDVLYMPPIHPIGKTHRKGRNNSLVAGEGDPGSPYAIGGAEGGHEAFHPELGGAEAFARLVQACKAHDMELALDFAIQCSPDHPWVREHPQWFARRPDGSIKFAENPPKKYEDIVNVDFYAPAALPGLWLALRDLVLLWVGRGVRIFRVDNPHTKPLPFWRWLIADVRARHPEVIFLAEAFARPAMMYELAKIGFSQSYTYFTWRNSRAELSAYLAELAASPASSFFRPNFFVNTPDINPFFLHDCGRAGFVIRAALAATLSGSWGLYSGFELCEHAPLPGKEEYLDSEKYQLRQRDWNAPGNIVGEISLLNRLRRQHPSLQTHLHVRFLDSGNEQVLFFEKWVPGSADRLLVAITLDPHQAQEAWLELPQGGPYAVQERVRGQSFLWREARQHWRFVPQELPLAIWSIRQAAHG